MHACIEEAGRLPARTPAGLLVKAKIVRDEVLMGSTMCADGVAESLVADLERLAGEAAPPSLAGRRPRGYPRPVT